MEERFEMFGMKLSIINQNTTKNIPKNLLKPRPDEKGETSSQQAWKLDDQTKIKGKTPLSEGIPKPSLVAKRDVWQMKGKGVAYSVPPVQIQPTVSQPKSRKLDDDFVFKKEKVGIIFSHALRAGLELPPLDPQLAFLFTYIHFIL